MAHKPAQNPAHVQGRVIAVHGRHCMVELTDGPMLKCFPRGKKSELAVGDYVSLQTQGETEGVVEQLHERRNLLYRSDDMRTKRFAANVDQLLLVVAVEPAFSHDLIGRAMVAAHSAGIEPLVVLNKIDLADDLEPMRRRIRSLTPKGTPIIEISALDIENSCVALLPYLADRTSLLLGQSGMGKSTILNALIPDARAHTQEHSIALDAGKHTTTSTRLYHVPNSGDVIDSPGFQTFGLFHLTPGEVERGFPEFADYSKDCRFYNCAHRQEPGCGVLGALGRGDITRERHELYLRILDENEARMRY